MVFSVSLICGAFSTVCLGHPPQGLLRVAGPQAPRPQLLCSVGQAQGALLHVGWGMRVREGAALLWRPQTEPLFLPQPPSWLPSQLTPLV